MSKLSQLRFGPGPLIFMPFPCLQRQMNVLSIELDDGHLIQTSSALHVNLCSIPLSFPFREYIYMFE